MNIEEMRKEIAGQTVTWNCIHRRQQHEVGCPHKEWTNGELLEALILKKKFEQSRLKGMILTS